MRKSNRVTGTVLGLIFIVLVVAIFIVAALGKWYFKAWVFKSVFFG